MVCFCKLAFTLHAGRRDAAIFLGVAYSHSFTCLALARWSCGVDDEMMNDDLVAFVVWLK